MKKHLFIIFLLSFTITNAQTAYLKKIKTHRKHLNQYFKNAKTSPLTKINIKKFKELPFFNVDKKYNVKAKLTYTFNAPIKYIIATDGKSEAYQQYAVANFIINHKKLSLSIYQSPSLKNKRGYQNYLFIPFTDLSNGKTTYSGGRYLDATIPKDATGYIYLDFNKAYNPYCAYNKKFTCPIPPENNHLDIEVLAGVKK